MWWPFRRGQASPEVEAALSGVRIFTTLEPRDLEELSRACLLRHYAAGESILSEGSTGLGLFVITSGRVEVFKTHEGRKLRLAVLEGGDVLGEMALLDDQPRSASAAALDDTDCLLLSRDRFRTLLKRRPRIAWPIVPPLVLRIRDLQEQLLAAGGERTGGRQTAEPASGAPPAGPVSGADAPETEDEPSAAHESHESDEAAGEDGSEPDVLRAPYALMMTGAVGFGESIRLLEVFCRSLDEESGLADGRPMSDVVRELPESLATAGGRSWDQGRRLPSKLLETFRHHLRSDWRGDDPENG